MYAAWLDDEYPDSVFVHVAYLSYSAQHEPKTRKERADYLNGVNEIVHRREHQVGFSQALADVRRSGTKKVKTSGAKVSYFRIDFPTGVNFVDAVYGKNGVLNLNVLAIFPEDDDAEGGIEIDIEWHVKMHESRARYGEDREDDTDSSDGERDLLASATKGMRRTSQYEDVMNY